MKVESSKPSRPSPVIGRLLGLLLVAGLSGGCGRDGTPAGTVGGQLRLGSLLGEADPEGYLRAEQPRTFRFPTDHGSHPGFRSEWWYLTIPLTDETGDEYGVHFTLFRRQLSPEAVSGTNGWRTNQAFLAHFAVTDVSSGAHEAAERFARGHPRLAGVEADPFRLWLEDWRLEADGDLWRFRAGTDGQRVLLSLRPTRLPVSHGEDGLSRKGPGQASYYYSVPDLEVGGELWVDGVPRRVSGTGWLDREWSTSVLDPGHLGWDWFALTLDSGQRLMAFQLRRRDGRRDGYDHGTLLEPSGRRLALTAEDFRLLPERWWTDEDGTRWPVRWSVTIGAEEWTVEAAVDDQRMRTAIDYWEGLVNVYDPEGSRIGRGYMELTGYGLEETVDHVR